MNELICSIFGDLLADGNGEVLIIFGVLGFLGLTCIVFGTVGWISTERQRQRTRREVAAYLAEGSITSEDAELILRGEDTKRA